MSTWTNLTVTYDESGYKRMYVDGTLRNSESITALPMTGNTGGFYVSNPSVSCPNGNGSFPGLISDVRIYNRALNDSDVNSIYTAMK